MMLLYGNRSASALNSPSSIVCYMASRQPLEKFIHHHRVHIPHSQTITTRDFFDRLIHTQHVLKVVTDD